MKPLFFIMETSLPNEYKHIVYPMDAINRIEENKTGDMVIIHVHSPRGIVHAQIKGALYEILDSIRAQSAEPIMRLVDNGKHHLFNQDDQPEEVTSACLMKPDKRNPTALELLMESHTLWDEMMEHIISPIEAKIIFQELEKNRWNIEAEVPDPIEYVRLSLDDAARLLDTCNMFYDRERARVNIAEWVFPDRLTITNDKDWAEYITWSQDTSM